MFNFTIPADGSSVPVADFAEAAKAALATLTLGDEEKGQAKAAVEASIALVKAGHVGEENVYVVIGGIGNPAHAMTPTGGSIISIDVHQRPASVQPVPVPEPAPVPPRRSPYETGATESEIAREAANTGKPIEVVAKELGAPTPAATVPTGDAARTQPTIATGKASAADKKAAAQASKSAAKAAKVTVATSTIVPHAATANVTAPQTNVRTSKSKPGAVEKQVAKDRAGKKA